MNASFRTAFWAMCLGLTVPMVLFVGAELTPGGRAARKAALTAADRRGSLRLKWDEARAKLAAGQLPPADSPGPNPGQRGAAPTKSPALTQKSNREKTASERRDPKVVLGPQLEPDQSLSDSESGHDRRVPAAVTTTRPRVEIIPEPGADIPDRVALETRLDGIQKHLERLGDAIATQAQREPAVDPVKQTMELLRLLRQTHELEDPLAQIPRLSDPEIDDDTPTIPQAEKTTKPGPANDAKNTDQHLPDAAQSRPRPQASPQTKIYHPLYLNGSALQALIVPLLTNGIGRAGAADTATTEASLETASDSSAAPVSAVVVRDFPAVLKKIDHLIQQLDVPPLSVVIEATVITIRLNAAMPYGIDLLEYNASGQPFIVRPADSNHFGPAAMAGERSVLTHGFGLKCGTLQGDPRAFINVLQSSAYTGRTHAWQINVLNRQTAQMMLDDPFGPNGSTGHVAGTLLKVRPVVTEKGVVHLDIHRDVADGPSAGSRSAALTNQIVLREGQTAVVAGFIAEHLATYCYRTPFVGRLPVVGRLFEKQSGVVERNETIVLLTPHVVETNAAVPPQARRSTKPLAPARGRPILKETAGKSPLAELRVAKTDLPQAAAKPARSVPASDPPAVRAAPQPAHEKPAVVAAPVQLAGGEVESGETHDDQTDTIPVLELPGMDSKPVIRPSPAKQAE